MRTSIISLITISASIVSFNALAMSSATHDATYPATHQLRTMGNEGGIPPKPQFETMGNEGGIPPKPQFETMGNEGGIPPKPQMQ